MAFWILDQWETPLDYPTLGFTADPDDVLEADAAPDSRWSSTLSGPETVTRYTIGSDPSYVEPGDGHLLAWSDADNAYMPIAQAEVIDLQVDAAVEQAVQDHTPGLELGYASRTSNFTTTNTVSTNAAGNITSISVTVVGTGRPVDVRFHCPSVYHSVANTGVSVVLIRDGNTTGADNQIGAVLSQSTTTGPSLTITRRTATLTAGVSYNFIARAWGSAAGTCTLVGASFCPIELSVTSR